MISDEDITLKARNVLVLPPHITPPPPTPACTPPPPLLDPSPSCTVHHLCPITADVAYGAQVPGGPGRRCLRRKCLINFYRSIIYDKKLKVEIYVLTPSNYLPSLTSVQLRLVGLTDVIERKNIMGTDLNCTMEETVNHLPQTLPPPPSASRLD